MDRQFADAERLFGEALKAKPDSGAAMAGLVRTALAEGKLPDALALALKFQGAHPNDVAVVDALGEVRFRRGEVLEAGGAYNQAQKLDPCFGRTFFDISRFHNLNGNYAKSQVALGYAHQLLPNDPMITRAWNNSQFVPPTPDQQIAMLREREKQDKVPAEEKAALENAIKGVQSREKGDCELNAPVETAKLPIYPSNSLNSSSYPPTMSGVDVFLNGKRRRFLVDTGASGLLLNSDAAKALGLTAEAETKTYGFGDKGLQGTFVAHVDSVKIGSMEFHNCVVRVLESKTMKWVDGLMGPDMFRNFLVTLDFPANEMRLGPLPRRPDETDSKASLSTSGETDLVDEEGQTIAARKKDRFIDPSMAKWQTVFRSGHDLIVPAKIGNAPQKLFILDTGSGQNLVSISAAREVTHVSASAGGHVGGISGEVEHVSGTDGIYIQFAGLRQSIPSGVNAIDLSNMSRGTGVEISGFIGYPLLSQLVMQIDYRDNLLNVTYTPHISPR